MRDPDPRTVQQARAGDLRAFEELVRLYQAEVFRFAWHLTRDRTLAEDVTRTRSCGRSGSSMGTAARNVSARGCSRSPGTARWTPCASAGRWRSTTGARAA